MAGALKFQPANSAFGVAAASRLWVDSMPFFVQELGILVERIETARPSGAAPDWQPGAILRLPCTRALSRDGVLCSQALAVFADIAMLLACCAAWNGYRPMSPIDHAMHFMRTVNVDVLADARIARMGRTTSFGRVMLLSAVDHRPVGMFSSAYAIL